MRQWRTFGLAAVHYIFGEALSYVAAGMAAVGAVLLALSFRSAPGAAQAAA